MVKVKQQIVTGTKYHITLAAKDGTDKKNTYEADVLVFNYSLELVEFKELLNAASSTSLPYMHGGTFSQKTFIVN